MAYELHIVEDTFDGFRRRIAKANAEVNLDATLVTAVANAPVASDPAPAAEAPKATRTRKAKDDAPAATAPAAAAAPVETPPAAPAEPEVTADMVRAVMGEVIKLHPQKAGAVTGFLAEHAAGAKNISSAAPEHLPALLKAGQDWLAANASDPTG
jgi:hypothetical protein